MKKKAKLRGYNEKEENIYDEEVELQEGFDQPALWNDARKVIELGLSFLRGELYDDDGEVFEEFERAFDPQSGEEIGCKISRNDGGIETHGIYAD